MSTISNPNPNPNIYSIRLWNKYLKILQTTSRNFIDDLGLEETIIMITRATLTSNSDTNLIIDILQKYWGLTYTKAIEMIAIEVAIISPCRNLEEYLITILDYSDTQAEQFFIDYKVEQLMCSTPTLRTVIPYNLKAELEKLSST